MGRLVLVGLGEKDAVLIVARGKLDLRAIRGELG